MADTITMPKLGFDMAEGTLIRWVKAEGESVNKGDVLAEIETDKATVEVESTYTGIINRLLVEPGSVVPVGTPIAVIAAPGEKVEEIKRKGVEKAVPPTNPTPAPTDPSVTPVVSAQAEAPAIAVGPVHASPIARRIAKENAVDLSLIRGTGPEGRIVRKDIETALAGMQSKPAPPTVAVTAAATSTAPAVTAPSTPTVLPLPGMAPGEVPPDQVITLSKLKATVGRRTQEAKQNVPHFYVTHEYNMEGVVALRKQINAVLPDDQKLSVNDFIVRAVALTLRQFPNLNASIKDNEIVRHGHVNVGNAVATENGLLTVVCKDTDQKPLRLISTEVKAMAIRARSGKVRPEDIEGSTFSISNLGMYDVENFQAIINPPEAAILAVASARQVPVVVNGELTVGSRMKATLSADHRVSDGAEVAQFMQALAVYLEEPYRLLM
jgi:pyruvate dehydrogenase E2 component (dihydrolipoamide acetyltransferase)